MTARVDLTPAQSRVWHANAGTARDSIRGQAQHFARRHGHETVEVWGTPTLPADPTAPLVPGVLLATVRP